jgi:DNA-binding transcriptional regulator YiaG
MKLNKIIKQLQQDSGMNQRDFAKHYEISYSTLNHETDAELTSLKRY